jgi:hypothetical protein
MRGTAVVASETTRSCDRPMGSEHDEVVGLDAAAFADRSPGVAAGRLG